MKEIPLTQGKVTLVDDEDFEWLSKFNWHYGCKGYAVRGIHHTGKEYMHVAIMHATSIFQVDHKNLNTLDNQKSNLRICTQIQNSRNIGISKANKSGYKGVSKHGDPRYKKEWMALIYLRGKGIHLGSFFTKEEAARAYDRAAKNLFGEFAQLNFPEGEMAQLV